jgi:hypothetical protein
MQVTNYGAAAFNSPSRHLSPRHKCIHFDLLLRLPRGRCRSYSACASVCLWKRQRPCQCGAPFSATNRHARPTAPKVWAVSVTGGNSTGKITFGTEGGLFQQELGIPAVVCGPGNIAVAHKPDEYVSEEQLALCDQMLARLLDRLSN